MVRAYFKVLPWRGWVNFRQTVAKPCVTNLQVLLLQQHIYIVKFSTSLHQECTNPGCQITVTTHLCTVAPNICGFLVWSLLQVTVQTPIILRWLLDFWKIKVPVIYTANIVKTAFLQSPIHSWIKPQPCHFDSHNPNLHLAR
jgi:hypothetical protein